MKRWIIEYFNIGRNRNEVTIIFSISDTPVDDVLERFRAERYDFVFPVMGIREGWK